METTVKIMEMIPIVLDFLSGWLKYLKAKTKPNGARKKLIR